MKIYRYQIETYQGVVDFMHGIGQTQERLYIPARGLIGYRNKEHIDFFTDNPKNLAEAQEIVDGTREGNYLGEIELPDEIVVQAISAGRALNQARATFKETAKTLIERIQE